MNILKRHRSCKNCNIISFTIYQKNEECRLCKRLKEYKLNFENSYMFATIKNDMGIYKEFYCKILEILKTVKDILKEEGIDIEFYEYEDVLRISQYNEGDHKLCDHIMELRSFYYIESGQGCYSQWYISLYDDDEIVSSNCITFTNGRFYKVEGNIGGYSKSIVEYGKVQKFIESITYYIKNIYFNYELNNNT